MSGSLTGRVAVDVDGDSPAGTTSPQAPFMLAVDLQRMDAEARWSLSSLKRLTLKHTIPGMVVLHSAGDDGAPRRLAFVVDRLSALVHSVQEAIKRRRR